MKRIALLFLALTAFVAASAKVTTTSWNDLVKSIKANRQNVTVVDVYATWCGPCRSYAPIFDQVSDKFPSDKFFRLDIDQNEKINDYISIPAIPFTIIFYYEPGEKKPSVLTYSGLMDDATLTKMFNQAKQLTKRKK